MTNARQRMLYGKTTPCRPSRFLEEIPEENMEWSGKPQPRAERDRWDDDWGDSGWGNSGYGGRSGGFGGYSTERSGYVERSQSGRSGDFGSPRSGYQTGRVVSEKRPIVSAGNSSAPAQMLQLQAGDMVEHSAFGKGEVLSLKPMGGDALIEVKFDNGVTKKLMLKAAGAYMKKL